MLFKGFSSRRARAVFYFAENNSAGIKLDFRWEFHPDSIYPEWHTMFPGTSTEFRTKPRKCWKLWNKALSASTSRRSCI